MKRRLKKEFRTVRSGILAALQPQSTTYKRGRGRRYTNIRVLSKKSSKTNNERIDQLDLIATTLVDYLLWWANVPVGADRSDSTDIPPLFLNTDCGRVSVNEKRCSSSAFRETVGAGNIAIRVSPGVPATHMYTMHLIPKKSGGVRMVHAPSEDMRIMQKAILNKLYDNTGAEATHRDNIAYVPGKGFVKAIRDMKLTQEHMLSVDLKNYYHQIHGSKRELSLVNSLKNTAFNSTEFVAKLLELAQKTVASMVATKVPSGGARDYQEGESWKSAIRTLQVATDLVLVSHSNDAVYLMNEAVAGVIGVEIERMKDIPSTSERMRNKYHLEEYLSSMELRAIDMLLTVLNTQANLETHVSAVSSPQTLLHAQAMRATMHSSSSKNSYGWKGPLVVLREAGESNVDNLVHWYGSDILSLERKRLHDLAHVFSPIVYLYKDVMRTFTSSLILLNYEQYDKAELSSDRSIRHVLRNMLLHEDEDLEKATKILSDWVGAHSNVSINMIQGILFGVDIRAKRLGLGEYIELTQIMTRHEKESVKTRFAYGLPQGALTSPFLANMVANTFLERIEKGYKEMESSGSVLHYENLRTIIYSDNVYALFDVVDRSADPTRRRALLYETGLSIAESQVMQVISDSVTELKLKINPDKTTLQSGDDKKLLGLLLDKNGNIRVPRKRVYETNQILLALHKSGGRPIDYKGQTYSAKDKRRLTGLLEWNKTVGREGYSQTMFMPDKKARQPKLIKKSV